LFDKTRKQGKKQCQKKGVECVFQTRLYPKIRGIKNALRLSLAKTL
jgi:hypothetical protein